VIRAVHPGLGQQPVARPGQFTVSLDFGGAVKPAGLLPRGFRRHGEQERPGGLPGQQSRGRMAADAGGRRPACDQACDHQGTGRDSSRDTEGDQAGGPQTAQ
jgi:hypothetical protein